MVETDEKPDGQPSLASLHKIALDGGTKEVHNLKTRHVLSSLPVFRLNTFQEH